MKTVIDPAVERERVWISLLSGKGGTTVSHIAWNVLDVVKGNSNLAKDKEFIDSIIVKDSKMVLAYASSQNKRELDLLFGQKISWGPYHSTEEYRVNFLNKTQEELTGE